MCVCVYIAIVCMQMCVCACVLARNQYSIQNTKTFPKCYVGRNVGRNGVKSAKTTHTSVWITHDTTESRVPRLNVHTNQILAHTFSQRTPLSLKV